jgi:hypothetical protein
MTGNRRPDDGDDQLDAELRRLFADDRLTLPVRTDADRTVVVGARRRRRNRLTAAAATGVLGVAALVFAAASLAGIGRAPGSVSAASTPLLSTTLTTDPPATTAPPTVADDADVVGPSGMDGYELGTSLAQLERDVVVSGRPLKKVAGTPPCVVYTVVGKVRTAGQVPTPPVQTTVEVPSVSSTEEPTTVAPRAVDGKPVSVLTILVAPKLGVVQVGGYGEVRTPEGVRTGMSEKRVFEAYKSVEPAKDEGAAVSAPVPGNARTVYVFDIDAKGVVTAVWVRQAGQLVCVP